MTRKQWIAIAAIVTAGALLAALVLWRGTPGPEAAARHEDKHEEHQHAPGKHNEHGTENGEHADKAHAPPETPIKLTEAQIAAAGIRLASAGPGRIQSSLQLPGEIRFNEDRAAHIVPRVTGIAESVTASLGQQVKKGQVLAIISSTTLSELRSELLAAEKRLEFARETHAREKRLWEEKISAQQDYLQARQQLREAEIAQQNARQKLLALGAGAGSAGALSRLEIKAPFDAMVVEKHIALGESVKEDAAIFTLSDLSTVWTQVAVPAGELDKVKTGASARVKATASEAQADGKVTYVSALIGEQTRAAVARIVLPNPQLAWRPGLYVNVQLNLGETEVPVAVPADAVHTAGDKTIVFVPAPGGFAARTVTPGRADPRWVEIKDGLRPGTPYAATGSFVLKAELGKGSAEHEH